jgi:predicted peptidase
MRPHVKTSMVLLRAGALAVCLQLAAVSPWPVSAQEPAAAPQQGQGAVQPPTAAPAPAPGRGRGPQPIDPRVQIRTHRFTETNEDIPYALFVSSKVRKGVKAPMIVSLHGLGGTHTTMMRPVAIDLAEAGGYILLAPMGYNPRGWFGAPAPQGRGRRGAPPAGAPPAPVDPPNVRELSEKETLQVVDLVRKEFTVDDDRTYVMGHSMGGAGALYLAMKYPQRWAAAVAIAPAAFSVDKDGLGKVPKMPFMIVHGDADTVVPPSVGRAWVEAMKALNINHQYIEVPGGDHGTVITSHQTDIYTFFAKHTR